MGELIDLRQAVQNLAKRKPFIRLTREGEIIYNQPCSTTDLYDATLVILRRGDGRCYVFKDRYGKHGTVVNEFEARWIAQDRAKSRREVLK